MEIHTDAWKSPGREEHEATPSRVAWTRLGARGRGGAEKLTHVDVDVDAVAVPRENRVRARFIERVFRTRRSAGISPSPRARPPSCVNRTRTWGERDAPDAEVCGGACLMSPTGDMSVPAGFHIGCARLRSLGRRLSGT